MIPEDARTERYELIDLDIYAYLPIFVLTDPPYLNHFIVTMYVIQTIVMELSQK